MGDTSNDRFLNLSYDDFRSMAGDSTLSPHEKIGFPDSYRRGKSEAILHDICRKLTNLTASGKVVMDIGPGCGELALKIIELCRDKDHCLHLVDSEEVLSQVPSGPGIRKHAGRFPADLRDGRLSGSVDSILAYSLLHYIFVEGNVFSFLDQALEMLAPGGQLLIGDVPNISKRKRFFGSENGRRFHQAFTGSESLPVVAWQQIEKDQIDDSVVFAIAERARLQGYDAYIVPQSCDLPMANRREDILIVRP